jgi:hypothetical protein
LHDAYLGHIVMLGVFNYKMLVLDFIVLFSRVPVGNEMLLCTMGHVSFHSFMGLYGVIK